MSLDRFMAILELAETFSGYEFTVKRLKPNVLLIIGTDPDTGFKVSDEMHTSITENDLTRAFKDIIRSIRSETKRDEE